MSRLVPLRGNPVTIVTASSEPKGTRTEPRISGGNSEIEADAADVEEGTSALGAGAG
jgi:hypothetical protein